jgi:hypothetical protein
MALPTAGGSVLFSLPAGWTGVAAADPFVVMAGRRCPFTTEGLLALAELIGRQRSQREGDGALSGLRRECQRTPVG